MNYPETLIYWIKERYAIFQKKEQGLPAPWSEDPVFQTTYFCNVHRENDRVTRWIRKTYSPFVDHPLFEYNIALARFLNRIESLAEIGWQHECANDCVSGLIPFLRAKAARGDTIWGNAYVITTHGQKMDKLAYLAQVLDLIHDSLDPIRAACRGTPDWPVALCSSASAALQRVDGIGSFLAGQIVADLKNTINHPLYSAPDRATFVVPGPGSLRGLGWYHFGDPRAASVSQFPSMFHFMAEQVRANWPEGVPPVDNQDLQNCLCEFDKYCRVKNGTGRSKRKYAGQHRG